MDSGTSQGTERAARIRLVLDCNEVFKQIAGLQQKLDQLSIKNMNKPQKGTASIADAIKRESIETEQAFNNFKRKVEVKQREIDDVLKKARKTGVSGANNNETNYNYQKALKAMEDNAAGLYRKMLETDNLAKRQVLAKELEKAQQQYQKLNRESANFRKSFGIQSSRGFYDLNSNLDYFFAKFRSRITYMMAENVQSALYNLPKSIFNNLADYQATRTNFAQVMPDHIANNQEEMNKAIQEFIQIGSDYGAVVEEVTDAGRLWGRQYKDVSMVQALVRNSTNVVATTHSDIIIQHINNMCILNSVKENSTIKEKFDLKDEDLISENKVAVYQLTDCGTFAEVDRIYPKNASFNVPTFTDSLIKILEQTTEINSLDGE